MLTTGSLSFCIDSARFVNLNASISISSGTEKGNTIYTLSTSQDVGRIAMEPLSSNYALNGTNGEALIMRLLFAIYSVYNSINHLFTPRHASISFGHG